MTSIIPSVFSTKIEDFKERLNLARQISDDVQIDIMDGKFVKSKSPDISLMPMFDGAEVHLMVENPRKYFNDCIKRGASKIIVHIESVKNIVEFAKLKLSLPKGIAFFAAIRPETNISKLADFIEDADGFLIMAHVPGVENKKLLTSTFERIAELRKLTSKPIEIDGGVRVENAKKLSKVGASILVSGSDIFSSKSPEKMFVKLEKAVEN